MKRKHMKHEVFKTTDVRCWRKTRM